MWQLSLTAGEVLLSWDLSTGALQWSDNVARVLGFREQDIPLCASDFLQRLSPDDAPKRALALDHNIAGNRHYACEYKLRRGDGGFEWIEERAVVLCAEDGTAHRVFARLRPVTRRRQVQDELEKRAYIDPLTGQLNRPRLLQSMAELVAAGDTSAGYLIINIDRLGMLNAAYGFDVVDEVIRATARRLEQTAGPSDLIGRVGGNQFGLISPHCGRTGLKRLAETILDGSRDVEIRTSAGPILISLSIGGVLLPEVGQDVLEAMGRAEEALSLAKRNGRDRFVCYRASAERDSSRRRFLATGDKVLSALRDGRITFAVQPIVRADDEQPALYECLLRMIGEDGAVVPAGLIMPAVEELGMVRRLDRHILELALNELEQVPQVRLGVNLSGMTATDPATLSHLLSMVHAHAHVADRLVFEITETVAMRDFEETARVVSKLRDLGCALAIDDFGAGYTSFRHLKTLDVDIVKIDGQFVQDLQNNRENQLFVRTLVELAKGFGVAVVAECVETTADAAALRTYGVDYLQGYLYGAPVLQRPWDIVATAAPRATLVSLGRR